MATPSDKLADALEALHDLQMNGSVAIRSADLSRTHRERLVQNGFLEEVIKGWYVPARPDETRGESTAWYASFWQFCAAYLNHLKGDNWCLSPEQSIAVHTENMTVPKQLLVRATKARNNVTELPHGTSLLDIRAALPEPTQVTSKNGLRIYSLPAALIACSKQSFTQNPTDMRAAGYDLRETDPFEQQSSVSFSRREQSPYVNRIRLMWQNMRETVIAHFPASPMQTVDKNAYMQHVEDVYVTDAYHSLSIEGYRVTPELITRVRTGDWNPEQDADDKERLNALAARGYWQAYQAVRNSIDRILDGHNAGEVVDNDHRVWYREMFAPGVTAGLHKPADLAGYRNAPIFIRRSMHTPPSREAVRDAMPAFFELLKAEENAAVRVVLGHFIFVYIHPYMDGNGRTGRFLMNAMLASGGYPWTIVPLKQRNDYMFALEEASTNQNIEPFTKFLGALVQASLDGKAEPSIPND